YTGRAFEEAVEEDVLCLPCHIPTSVPSLFDRGLGTGAAEDPFEFVEHMLWTKPHRGDLCQLGFTRLELGDLGAEVRDRSDLRLERLHRLLVLSELLCVGLPFLALAPMDPPDQHELGQE